MGEAQKSFIDGHIAGRGGSRVDDQARSHFHYDGNNLGGGQELPQGRDLLTKVDEFYFGSLGMSDSGVGGLRQQWQ